MSLKRGFIFIFIFFILSIAVVVIVFNYWLLENSFNWVTTYKLLCISRPRHLFKKNIETKVVEKDLLCIYLSTDYNSID